MKDQSLTRVLVSTTALAVPMAVSAQTAEEVVRESGQAIQEVVVTARRVQESMQRVPVAATSLSSADLVQAQVRQVTDLQSIVPSLSVATGAPSASGFAFVAIRGQGSLNASVSVDPAVATYVDGVYIARPSQGQVELTDLDRVEVLRGPQGTLFGRNTTGGALNLFTVDPQDEFAGRVRAGFGSEGDLQFGAMINAPIGEQTAFRLTYDHREHDGYGRNVTLGRDANDLTADTVRGKLLWEAPENEITVLLAGDYTKQEDKGQLVTLAAANPLSPLGFIFPLDPNPVDDVPVGPSLAAIMNGGYQHTDKNFYSTYGTGYSDNSNIPNRAPYNEIEAYGFAGTVTAQAGELNIKSITAYRYSDSRGFIDLDATPIPVLATESGYESEAFSQEFQFSRTFSERLFAMTGFYYSRETGQEFSDFQPFGLFKGLAPPAVGFVGRNDGDVKNTTYGAFAQGNYNFTDQLRLTAGLRWTWDEREVELHNVQVSGAPGDDIFFNQAAGGFVPNCVIVPDSGDPARCTQTNSENFDYPAWTIGLDYQATDQLLLYAKSSQASHAGGWNLRANAAPAFDPEELTDVEIGMKSDWLDHHLRLNVALYHSWLDDAQRVVSAGIGDPPISTSFISNSGDIQVDGLEVEAIVVPWDGMQVQLNYSYMSGDFDKGSFVDDLGDRSNEPLIQFPENQFGVGATQQVALSFGELSFRLDYGYISSQHFYTTPDNPANGSDVANRLGKIDSYGLLNGRIALTLGNPDLEIALWGRNLTDEKYVTRSFPDLYTSLGIATNYVGDPRTYGLMLNYQFGGK